MYVLLYLLLICRHYVFINRGWVGRNRKPWSKPEGKVVISGLYQPFEKVIRSIPCWICDYYVVIIFKLKPQKNYFSPESKVTARAPRPSTSPSGDIGSNTESSPTPSTLIWLEESAVMENALSNTSLEADYVPLILEHIDTSTGMTHWLIDTWPSLIFSWINSTPVSKKDAIVFPFPRNTYEVQHFVGPETHVAYAFTWYIHSVHILKYIMCIVLYFNINMT